MLTKAQQAKILHDAARMSNMDGHVYDGPPSTCAEKAMVMFGTPKNTPRKNSYLYCNSVDACFYFERDIARMTITAKLTVGCVDIDTLKSTALDMVKTMLQNMQKLADEFLSGEEPTP